MPRTDGDERGADLGASFDGASALYQQARPDYPTALIDRVIEITGVRAGDQVLEIGCATGKATLPFARRGFRITCIEPGSNLAATAREVVYDAEGYIDLLNTFSGHIVMQPWQRERLYTEIRRRLAERSDGRLRRHWGGVLHVARRRD